MERKVKKVDKPVQTTIYDIFKAKNKFEEIKHLTFPTFDIEYKEKRNEFLREASKRYSSEQYSKIEKALKLAEKVHKNQRRETGEPYMIHPLTVAKYIMEAKLNHETVITGLLHDVMEDGDIRFKELEEKFGNTIAKSVAILTKPKLYKGEWISTKHKRYFEVEDEYSKLIGDEKFEKYKERNNYYYPKIDRSDSFIPRLVKAFDNAHNIETSDIFDVDKQLRTLRKNSTSSLLTIAKVIGFENKKLKEIADILKKNIPDFDLEENLGKIEHSNPIIELPPRTQKSHEMFLEMPLPKREHISIYGNEKSCYLMGYIEIGFPRTNYPYIKVLKEKLNSEKIKIHMGESELPKEVAASEKIIVLELCEPKVEKIGKKYRLIGTNLKFDLENFEISNTKDSEYKKIKKTYFKLKKILKEIYKDIINY